MALPTTIDAQIPVDDEAAGLGASRIRELKQQFLDVLSLQSGVPVTQPILPPATTGYPRVDAGVWSVVQATIFDLSVYASLADALTTLGSTVCTLRVSEDATISATAEIPRTMSLAIVGGAKLTIATGVTLTISGALIANVEHLFVLQGTGKVVFGSGSVGAVYPQWWGAVADYNGTTGTDNTAAFQAMIDALANTIDKAPPILIPCGRYKQVSPVTMKGQFVKVFANGAEITYTGAGATDYAWTVATDHSPQHWTILGLALIGNSSALGGFNFGVESNTYANGPWLLMQVKVSGFTQTNNGRGIRTKYSIYFTTINCELRDNGYGLYAEVESNAMALYNTTAVSNDIAGMRLANSYTVNIYGGSTEQSVRGIICTGQGSYNLHGVYFEAQTDTDLEVGSSAKVNYEGCIFNSGTATRNCRYAMHQTDNALGIAGRHNYYQGYYDYYIHEKLDAPSSYPGGFYEENHLAYGPDLYKKIALNLWSTAKFAGIFDSGGGYDISYFEQQAKARIIRVVTNEPNWGSWPRGSQYWLMAVNPSAAPGAINVQDGSGGTLRADFHGSITTGTTALNMATVAIEGLGREASCVVTWTGHPLLTGDYVAFAGITQSEWTALNGQSYSVVKINANTFSIPVDTSGFSTAYVPASDPGTYATSAGLYPGAYINIVGVTGPKRIVSLTGDVVTIDSNADASVTDADISFQAPSWKTMAPLGA